MGLTSLRIRPRSRGQSRGSQPGFSSRIRPGLRFFPAVLFSIGVRVTPIPSHFLPLCLIKSCRRGPLTHRDEGGNGLAIGSNHRPSPVIKCSRRLLFRPRFAFGSFLSGPPTGPIDGDSCTAQGRFPYRSKGIQRPICTKLSAKRLFEDLHLFLDRAQDPLDLGSEIL
jgi:hypothetical protein